MHRSSPDPYQGPRSPTVAGRGSHHITPDRLPLAAAPTDGHHPGGTAMTGADPTPPALIANGPCTGAPLATVACSPVFVTRGVTQFCCEAPVRRGFREHPNDFQMRSIEEFEYSSTICFRCGDKERLIVRTQDGVVSRCYACGDEASWLRGARTPATSAAALAGPRLKQSLQGTPQ